MTQQEIANKLIAILEHANYVDFVEDIYDAIKFTKVAMNRNEDLTRFYMI